MKSKVKLISAKDGVWGFALWMDIARTVFGCSMLLEYNRNKLITNYNKDNLLLIKAPLEGSVKEVGIVSFTPNAVMYKDNTFGYLTYFGLIPSARNLGYGTETMKMLLKQYPNIILHTKYPNNKARSLVVEFYRELGFKEEIIIRDNEKYLIMSTIKLVLDPKYKNNAYPAIKELEDILQTKY